MTKKSEIIPLRGLLQRAVVTVASAFLIVAILASGYISISKFQKKEAKHEETVHTTLAELLKPAILISDFMDIQRLLKLVTKKDTLYGLVIGNKDLLLYDYAHRGIFQKALGSDFSGSCPNWIGENILYEGNNWRFFCTEVLLPENSLSVNSPNPKLVSLRFFSPLPFSWSDFSKMALPLCLILVISVIYLKSLVAKNILKPIEILVSLMRKRMDKKENYSASILPAFTPIPFEIEELRFSFNDLLSVIQDHYGERSRFEKILAMNHIATRVAHDIRSPLSALQTAIGMLSSLKTEDEKGALNLLELSAKRLTGIADDLLKKHQGEEAGEGVVFSIHHVLDELIGEFGGQEQYKDVRFVKRYDSGAIHIRGDGAKLQRAFGNILKNAAEAMEFSGKITVTTKAGEDRASVEIADTGPGMSEEKLEKVLAGGFTEGKDDGHGIGTKVVKETVAEHHGTLRAESTVGQGTAFFIDLPRVTQTLPITTFTLRLNPKERVLIVDDEASLREQWRLTLEDRGINTLLCKSYEDVVEQGISGEITTAAIVDYHFNNSEKNGVDIVKYLQSVGFTNLTLCTAEYWKPQLQRESQELGVPICPKPIPKIVVHPHPDPLPEGEGRGEGKSVQHGYNILVIDDDLGIRMSWDFSREKLNISHLHCYANLEELQSNEIDLATVDIAFVDKNIAGSAHTAAEVIQFLREKGIPKIILASGESKQALEQDPLFHSVNGVLTEKIPATLEGLV